MLLQVGLEVWGWDMWGWGYDTASTSPAGATVQSWVQRNPLKQPGPAVFNLAND